MPAVQMDSPNLAADLSPALSLWRAAGQFVETCLGHLVYCQQLGNPDATAQRTLLLLHGFPESSYSYHKVLPGLAQMFERVVLFDMPGYGLSDKPTDSFGYSLLEQADVALQVWGQLGVTGGHLLAHDMGDSVATELVARQVSGLLPSSFSAGFKSFTFTNGSMVLELAELRMMQKVLLSRLGPLLSGLSTFRLFRQQVRSAHGNDRIGDDDIAMLWENVCQQDGQRKNHLMIRYLTDRKRFEKTRWLPSLSRVGEPVHLCWGEADAVARVAMAHFLKAQVCPAAKLTLMPNVGHFCQLSDPESWLEGIATFY